MENDTNPLFVHPLLSGLKIQSSDGTRVETVPLSQQRLSTKQLKNLPPELLASLSPEQHIQRGTSLRELSSIRQLQTNNATEAIHRLENLEGNSTIDKDEPEYEQIDAIQIRSYVTDMEEQERSPLDFLSDPDCTDETNCDDSYHTQLSEAGIRHQDSEEIPGPKRRKLKSSHFAQSAKFVPTVNVGLTFQKKPSEIPPATLRNRIVANTMRAQELNQRIQYSEHPDVIRTLMEHIVDWMIISHDDKRPVYRRSAACSGLGRLLGVPSSIDSIIQALAAERTDDWIVRAVDKFRYIADVPQIKVSAYVRPAELSNCLDILFKRISGKFKTHFEYYLAGLLQADGSVVRYGEAIRLKQVMWELPLIIALRDIFNENGYVVGSFAAELRPIYYAMTCAIEFVGYQISQNYLSLGLASSNVLEFTMTQDEEAELFGKDIIAISLFVWGNICGDGTLIDHLKARLSGTSAGEIDQLFRLVSLLINFLGEDGGDVQVKRSVFEGTGENLTRHYVTISGGLALLVLLRDIVGSGILGNAHHSKYRQLRAILRQHAPRYSILNGQLQRLPEYMDDYLDDAYDLWFEDFADEDTARIPHPSHCPPCLPQVPGPHFGPLILTQLERSQNQAPGADPTFVAPRCPYCNFEFHYPNKSTSQLAEYLNRHKKSCKLKPKDLKLRNCPICTFSSSGSDTFYLHVATHRDNNMCPLCDKGWPNPQLSEPRIIGYLKTHLKVKHEQEF